MLTPPSRKERQSPEHEADRPPTRISRMSGHDDLSIPRSLQIREGGSGEERFRETIVSKGQPGIPKKRTVGWFGTAARAAGLGHPSPSNPKPWIEQYRDEMQGYSL